MSVEPEQIVRTGLDITNQFAGKMRTDASAVEGARAAHPALRGSMDEVRSGASTQRVSLAANSSGNTTDLATSTSASLEQEIEDLLTESAEIEAVVVEAAEALHVGNVKNDQIRDEIIRDISETMQLVAALRQQQAPEGPAAARAELMKLFQRLQEHNGMSAQNADATLTKLSGIAGKLGGDEQATSASSASGGTQVASSFNNNGSGGSGGGGGTGGGGYGGGGGAVSKPRLPVAIPPQPGTGVAVNLPDGSTFKAPNETAARAVRAAISQLGVPYLWGGTARGEGLDCSGLTMTSYGEAGLTIPRTAAQQTVGGHERRGREGVRTGGPGGRAGAGALLAHRSGHRQGGVGGWVRSVSRSRRAVCCPMYASHLPPCAAARTRSHSR